MNIQRLIIPAISIWEAYFLKFFLVISAVITNEKAKTISSMKPFIFVEAHNPVKIAKPSNKRKLFFLNKYNTRNSKAPLNEKWNNASACAIKPTLTTRLLKPYISDKITANGGDK